MTSGLILLGVYLLLGIIAIVLLDLRTRRVRNRLKTASVDTQSKLALSGSFVDSKMALIITVIALWIFWPAAIYGAIKK